MRNGFLFGTLVLFLGGTSWADYGDIIVGLKNSTGVRSLQSLGVQVEKVLSEDQNIVLLRPIYRVLDSRKIAQSLRESAHVRWAQEDHPVTLREVVPNDPDFSRQWALKTEGADADIRATLAWSIGQGGKTIDGSDVVVAVVDQGVDVTHPSLQENLWRNLGEIADNGLDDDGNGYVDDVHGWDAVSDSGKIPAGSHATHVAGIIGARGNDSQQVVGVNWDAKIMSVRVLGYGGSKSFTSQVVDGYNYIIRQKKAWLESGGAEGANIVATNSSFGVDRGNCASGDYPVWNEMYDSMGAVGILSAAATINGNYDVDQIGDVPTACSSDFIVAVTNTTNQGKKYNGAGYGANHIDLGAPGTNILSTVLNQGVGEKTGTSMATPHVAGAIGFLHSVASRDFRELAKNEPSAAALYIKQALISTVTLQEDLQGRTLSGGRLNLMDSATNLAGYTSSSNVDL